MRCYLEITSVPIPRLSNPLSAPAAALLGRMQDGEVLELRYHRNQHRIRCFLGLPSRDYLKQAMMTLKAHGYTFEPDSQPEPVRTTLLLGRNIQNHYLLRPDTPPKQLLMPVPMAFDPQRADALFVALNHADAGSGISFFFRRILHLPLNTVTHLHRMDAPKDSVIHRLLYAPECFEFTGCVYGSPQTVRLLTSEVCYALSGLSQASVSSHAVEPALLGRFSNPELPDHLMNLTALLLPEEAAALTDLSPSAGVYGLPFNKDTLFGIPKPRSPVSDGLRLGFEASGDPVDISLWDLRKSMLIASPPGHGKGNMIFSFAYQLHEAGIPFLLIESQKNEQHALHRMIPGLQVWRPKEQEFVFNPFALPDTITLGEYRSSLLTMLRQAFSLDGPLEFLFADAMNRAFARNGFRDDSTVLTPGTVPFGLSEFMEEFTRLLNEQNYSARTQQDVKTAGLVRLQSLFNQNRAVFDSVCSVPLPQLLQGENLLQLNCLSEEAKQMFASLLLISIGAWFRLRGKHCSDTPAKLVIIVDEAHTLLREMEDAQGKRYSFAREYSNMLLTLRSQGIAFITVTQTTGTLPRLIADICETKLFLGSSPYSGIGDYREVLHADDTALNHLYLLGPGEGVYCNSTCPAGIYFKSPNIIDGFDLHKEHPRNNAFLKAHPRFTLETFAQCASCPAKGTCTHSDKIAARREAAVLLPRLTELFASSDPEKQKLARQRLFSHITLQTGSNAQRFCTLIQFLRDYNRIHPGVLNPETFLSHGQGLWEKT